MSHELEGRVGALEQEVARQGEKLGRVEADVGKIATGVDKLLDRDARRGEGLSFKSAAMTCSGLAAIAVVVWWLIDTAPAVRDLRARMDHAEWKYGWASRLDRGG